MNSKQVAYKALELACVALVLDRDNTTLYDKAFELRTLLRVGLKRKEINKGNVWAIIEHGKALQDVD